MEPALPAGSLVLGWRWSSPKVGNVVVVNRDRPLVKRVTSVRRGQFWVEGDNSQSSTDSRRFGWLNRRDLEAVVIVHSGR